MLIPKEVLRPGTYWYVDEATGLPRSCTFSPADIDHFHQSGKDMLAAGLSVPVPLEHQKDAKPFSASDQAAQRLLNNAGHVQDYFKQKVRNADGSEVDALFATLDISDPKVIEKIPRTIRWTSPYISSFTDGQGKSWNGVITHLALTTRPRITNQLPFPDIAASLTPEAARTIFDAKSFAGGGAGLSLSRAGLLAQREQASTFEPMFPVAFSLYSGTAFGLFDYFKQRREKKASDSARLQKIADRHSGGARSIVQHAAGVPKRQMKRGSTALAKDDDETDKPSAEDVMEDDDQDTSQGYDEQEVKESLVDSDGDINIYQVIADLLDAVGIPLPPETNEDNFCQNLYEAAMAKIKGGQLGANNMPEPNKPGNNNGAKPPVVQEAPPLYMSLSLEDIGKIADPGQKAIALAIHGLRSKQEELAKENASLKNGAMNAARARRQVRLDRLKAKLPKERFEKVAKMAEGMSFALSAEGVVQDMMEAMLEVLEEERDLPALLTTPASSVVEVQHPKEYGGELSPERRAEVVEMLCQQGGLRPLPKAS